MGSKMTPREAIGPSNTDNFASFRDPDKYGDGRIPNNLDCLRSSVGEMKPGEGLGSNSNSKSFFKEEKLFKIAMECPLNEDFDLAQNHPPDASHPSVMSYPPYPSASWVKNERERAAIPQIELGYGKELAVKGVLFIGGCASALNSTQYDVNQDHSSNQQLWYCLCCNCGIWSGAISCTSFVLVATTLYHLNKEDHHQDKFLLVGMLSGIFIGLCFRADLQTIMLSCMSWTVLCALFISGTYHQTQRKGGEGRN